MTIQIQTIFSDSRQTYGRARVPAELQAPGIRCARKRVARLMRQTQLCARAGRRRVRTTDSRHTEPVAANLLARSFQAEAPNRVWVAWDNAAMESFLATLKADLPLTVCSRHAAARSAVFDSIERF